MTTKCGHDIKLVNELFVVLLRGNGVFGENTFAGGGQSLAADVAKLVAVSVGVSVSRIGAYVSTADRAKGSAIVIKGVTDVVQCRAAVFAFCGAGIKAYVTAVGIRSTANGAGFGASVSVGVCKAGAFAADVANVTAFGSGSYVSAGCGSLLTADVTSGIAIAVIGVSNGLIDLKGLAAVTANRTASGNGLVRSSRSVTGGAAFDIAGCIASAGVGVSRYSLAAAFNRTDAVAVERSIVETNVIANRFANVADVVGIGIHVLDRLGSAAGIASQCVAGALPNVLLGSFVAAAVVADLVASGAECMRVIGSYVVAGAAGAAASELKVMRFGIYGSGCAAVDTSNGAFKLVGVVCLAGRITEGALGGAGMKPCVLKLRCGADLFTNVALNVTCMRIGVNDTVSLCAANGAGGGALGSVGVLQIGADRSANGALGSAVVLVLVCKGLKRGLANGADGAIAGLARVLNRRGSFHRIRTAIAERIAIGAVRVALGTETTRKRNERQGNG